MKWFLSFFIYFCLDRGNMQKIYRQIKKIILNIDIKYIDEHAAGCSYYTILAFIPLLLLILTLTKYFGIDEKFFIYIL